MSCAYAVSSTCVSLSTNIFKSVREIRSSDVCAIEMCPAPNCILLGKKAISEKCDAMFNDPLFFPV